ncbi:hypothetical protein HaLaN_27339 [Haematococcus lacustris]|uniref:Uncharacterized protein n=1 Tax=Haematococcus lacustris TaxID=44745 RepID=A0A6A0A8K6_HAELA|nr:hypothetical protein HaLaN_27339 [Haematococcus lacustris]
MEASARSATLMTPLRRTIAILVGAGVAACSNYRSGPKLQPRVKIDALIRDRAIRKQWYTAPQNGKRPGLSER